MKTTSTYTQYNYKCDQQFIHSSVEYHVFLWKRLTTKLKTFISERQYVDTRDYFIYLEMKSIYTLATNYIIVSTNCITVSLSL